MDFRAEEHGNVGRSDFTVNCGAQTWIIEVKISHKAADDEKLAVGALRQIKTRNYGGGRRDPVLLGLAVNDEKKAVTAWRCEGGLAAGPRAEATEDEARPRPRPR
jgi:hypothetical protein